MSKITKALRTKVLQNSAFQNSEINDHNKFIAQIMEEDGLDEETARNLCLGLTDPVDYHYTLGYKMSSQMWQYAMFHQKRAKLRQNARLNFREDMLCPEEQILFDEYVEELENMWREEAQKHTKR